MEKPPPYNPNLPPQPTHMAPPPPYQAYPVDIGFTGSSSTTVVQIPTAGYGSTPMAGYGAMPTTTIINQTPGVNYGSVPIVVQPVRATDVIVVGGCPACRVGVLSEEFTLAGLCCAFWFFPLGLLCCLLMREKRCTNCSATFT